MKSFQVQIVFVCVSFSNQMLWLLGSLRTRQEQKVEVYVYLRNNSDITILFLALTGENVTATTQSFHNFSDICGTVGSTNGPRQHDLSNSRSLESLSRCVPKRLPLLLSGHECAREMIL